MPGLERIAGIETPGSVPHYKLRSAVMAPSAPSTELATGCGGDATDDLGLCLAGLRSRNLELVEYRVLKRQLQTGIKPGRYWCRKTRLSARRGLGVDARVAVSCARPDAQPGHMRAVATGIEAMGHEEAACWLGVALHLKHPRRVLPALRFPLTEPLSRR